MKGFILYILSVLIAFSCNLYLTTEYNLSPLASFINAGVWGYAVMDFMLVVFHKRS